MQRIKFFLIPLTLSLVMFSCNTSQNEQLNQINNSLTSLKPEFAPRYQIVQSSIAARGTYKVDTYLGNVYQLVVDANDNESWQQLSRKGNVNNDITVEGQRNYEIFLSTIAMKFTYLINLNTGATWQLVQDPDTEEIFFSPIND